MNAKILAAAAVLAAISAPASAEIINYNGFYAGAFGGYSYLNGNESTPYSGTSVVGVTSEIEYDAGPTFGGALGWSWGTGLRTELEYAYHTNDIGDVDPGTAGVDGGDITLHTVMANVLYDLPLDWYVRPYAGVGVGVGAIDYSNVSNLGGFTIDDSDTGLAWQGIAGLSIPITPRFSASLEYRWVATEDFQLDTTSAGVNSQLGYSSHNATVALRYQFGDPVGMPAPMPATAPMPVYEPAPAAPAPVPVPPPAPRAVAPVVPQTYIVFFDFDKSIITPEAERVLQRAAQDVRVGQGARIHVVGHADRAGTARYNVRLSERRSKVVHDRLVELGVGDEQITTRSMGETQNRVPTADGVREAQNRRAEIIFQ